MPRGGKREGAGRKPGNGKSDSSQGPRGTSKRGGRRAGAGRKADPTNWSEIKKAMKEAEAALNDAYLQIVAANARDSGKSTLAYARSLLKRTSGVVPPIAIIEAKRLNLAVKRLIKEVK